MSKKKLKVNVTIDDMEQGLIKDIFLKSLEQNEKQLCVYLIQREIEGESEENTAAINGIHAYISKMKKLLITKFS